MSPRLIAPIRALCRLCLLPACLTAFGQAEGIQWASRVERQFNLRDDAEYRAGALLGPPDAFPPGALHRSAARLSAAGAYATAVLGFDRPQQVQHLIVVESFQPGRIQRLSLIDTGGGKHLVYHQPAAAHPEDFRTLHLVLPETPYLVSGIEIELNSHPAPGTPQIDAVGIAAAGARYRVQHELSGANFNRQELPAFAGPAEVLGGQINTPYAEVKPLVSPDGRTLFFSRMYFPGNTGGKADPQDIYFARLLDGRWTPAQNMGGPLNDPLANGICSVSPDGNTLFLMNHYDPDGSVRPGLSRSERTPRGWSEPRGIDIEDFHTEGFFQDICLSADGRVLVLALQRSDGYGRQDLYVSLRRGDASFGRPVNLGPMVNTFKADFAPMLMPDGRTLYFASEGHRGFGQSDVYVTYRLDESWQSWSRPHNLGPAVNGTGWEAYFTVTAGGDYAYFVASEKHPGAVRNICRIPLLGIPAESESHGIAAEPGVVLAEAGDSPHTLPDHLLSGANPLMFERSKSILLDESWPALEELAGLLLDHPQWRIELAGHTDALGSEKARQELSLRRVDRIRDLLVSLGVERVRISTTGYGSSRPLAPNDTEENRAKNRRVEITLLESGR
jgi:OmpA-OmpF porin, OOP family